MRIRRTSAGHTLKFEAEERELLSHLANTLCEYLTEWAEVPLADADVFEALETQMQAVDDDDRSPLVERLFPDAYRDDPRASFEFRRFTEREQARAKVESMRTVLADLAAPGPSVRVAPEHFEAWIKTITNLRLMLSVRITEPLDGDLDADEVEELAGLTAINDWLAWLLESLLD